MGPKGYVLMIGAQLCVEGVCINIRKAHRPALQPMHHFYHSVRNYRVRRTTKNVDPGVTAVG